MKQSKAEILRWALYKPAAWQERAGYRARNDRCRHDVFLQNQLQQCARLPTVTIEGYGFCRQHAAMVRTRLKNAGYVVEEA